MEAQQIQEIKDLEVDENSPFVESGACSDEIVLTFDDGNKLFVSQNFLSYASPVFEAMFRKGFKELEEKNVTLHGKDHDEVMELLKCIHPAILKPVDRTNAIQLMALAEEYQMSVIKERCETVLNGWLEEVMNSSVSSVPSTRLYQRAEVCLKILAQSVALKHDVRVEKCKSILSQCNFKAITGVYFTTKYEQTDQDPIKHRENCAKIFRELPDNIQISILLARLNVCDKC